MIVCIAARGVGVVVAEGLPDIGERLTGDVDDPVRHVIFPDAQVRAAYRQLEPLLGVAQLAFELLPIRDVDVAANQASGGSALVANRYSARESPLERTVLLPDLVLQLEARDCSTQVRICRRGHALHVIGCQYECGGSELGWRLGGIVAEHLQKLISVGRQVSSLPSGMSSSKMLRCELRTARSRRSLVLCRFCSRGLALGGDRWISPLSKRADRSRHVR